MNEEVKCNCHGENCSCDTEHDEKSIKEEKVEHKEKKCKKDKHLDKLNEAYNKISELEDSLLRSKADFINYRKRLEDEQTRLFKYCNEDLVKEMLPIIDSLERAINMDDNNLDDEVSKFLSGVKMIYCNLTSVLNKYGDSVEVVEPEDKDEYTAHTFMDLANSQEFYVSYNIADTSDTNIQHQYTVAKLAEVNAGGQKLTNYSVEYTRANLGSSGENQTTHYFLQDNLDGTFTVYNLDVDLKTASVTTDFVLDYLSFNFSLPYAGKEQDANGDYYSFVSQSQSSEYIYIRMKDGEVSSIATKDNGVDLLLNVVGYGTEPRLLNLTTSLEGFEISVQEG